jgi:hypothetical protein
MAILAQSKTNEVWRITGTTLYGSEMKTIEVGCLSEESCQGNGSSVAGIGERVIVQYPQFRCLAYRDKKGQWHDAIHKALLVGNPQVVYRF